MNSQYSTPKISIAPTLYRMRQRSIGLTWKRQTCKRCSTRYKHSQRHLSSLFFPPPSVSEDEAVPQWVSSEVPWLRLSEKDSRYLLWHLRDGESTLRLVLVHAAARRPRRHGRWRRSPAEEWEFFRGGIERGRVQFRVGLYIWTSLLAVRVYCFKHAYCYFNNSNRLAMTTLEENDKKGDSPNPSSI